MLTASEMELLDCPANEMPPADEFIAAAMKWHFSPDTGSKFWLDRRDRLRFDPLTEITSFDDLRKFPNFTDEMRDIPFEELIPKGYGDDFGVFGVFESGGTTGSPKRVAFLTDWLERIMFWFEKQMEEWNTPHVNWLAIVPTGPHMFGLQSREQARRRGGYAFTVDFDPRWVKKCISEGRPDEAERYTAHLLEQSRYLLETQDIGVLVTTPPMLERIARDQELLDMVNEKVTSIHWGGAHMDADTRYLMRTEVFPNAALHGGYGSTMILGGTWERVGLGPDDPCIFDTFSPYITFRVVDPETGEPVEYGARGQVVMNHVSKSMLVPNNLERDEALRIEGPEGQAGDSVADVTPVAVFGGQKVVEGVY